MVYSALVKQIDSLSQWQAERPSPAREAGAAVLIDRTLIVTILIFGLGVAHSIAAAQIAYLSGVVCWLGRALLARSPRREGRWWERPLLLPLLCFALLTVISAVFSSAPEISLVKSKSLGLFLVFFLIHHNLSRRGALALAVVLVVSSLIGVGYSLTEKLVGRGMVIEFIDRQSPLAGMGLQPGDVIWMIARRRVSSPEEMREVIARHQSGEKLSVEALHAGDPVPVELTVTETLRLSATALGIRGGGSSRRFRVSGFTRQFITYAEQMQLLGLWMVGLLLVGGLPGVKRFAILALLLFAGGLILTATRSVIVSFVAALLIGALLHGGRRMLRFAIPGALLIAALGTLAVVSSRRELMARFSDDSVGRRIAYMQAGLRVVAEHPLLGVGLDAHKKHWREWGFPGDYVTHTHSTPIQVALDRGLPALGCLIWLGIAAWIWLRRASERAGAAGDLPAQGLAAGGAIALIGFSLSAIINYNFGDSETLMLLLAILGATGAAQTGSVEEKLLSD
ncbi:MAG: O-antigen ligase family protein [Acidobacteriota bacterium]